jgi:hypothetical protein
MDMCGLVRNKYVPRMLLRAYRAAELQVNMLKDNIKMDFKEIALMTTWNESNFISIQSYHHHYQPGYLVENEKYLDQMI